METLPSGKDFHAPFAEKCFDLCLRVAGGLRRLNDQDHDVGFHYSRADERQCCGGKDAAIYGYGDGDVEYGRDLEHGWWSFQWKHHKHRALYGTRNCAQSRDGDGHSHCAGRHDEVWVGNSDCDVGDAWKYELR
jgi:hypothetical protein